jgi:GTP cyclohydrolase I
VTLRSSADRLADLRTRLRVGGADMSANANIAEYLVEGDLEAMEEVVGLHVGAILDALTIDRQKDHNTKETAERVARMYVREVFAGRYLPPPKLTEFPNAKQLDEVYTVGPITIRSACSHHMVPITGKLWVGVIPGSNVIGLSKFTRLANWIMRRPHIQEEAVVMLADALEEKLKPKALAVVLKASHHCMTWRGVEDNDTLMTTSVMRGLFLTKPEARAEFMQLIGA